MNKGAGKKSGGTKKEGRKTKKGKKITVRKEDNEGSGCE